MQVNKKIMLLSITSLLISLPSGCTVTKEPGKLTLQTSSVQHPQQNTKPPTGSVVKRFQEPASQGPTTVESAIELSEKYAKLSKQVVLLQQKKQDLITENHHIKQQLTTCESQLQQTQKELAEANDLLIEMRIELNNWKTNILSFRDEMRDADTAQLQALLKILNILGGGLRQNRPRVKKRSQLQYHQTRPSSLNHNKPQL